MSNYLVPAPEETELTLKFANGQANLTLDALDIDTIVTIVQSKGIPEDSSFYKEFTKVFFQKYQRRISHTTVHFLCREKDVLIGNVKKNWSILPEPSATTEQEQI